MLNKLQILLQLLLLSYLAAAQQNTFTIQRPLEKFPKLCEVKDFDDFLLQTGKVYNEKSEYEFRAAIFYGTKSVVDLTNRNALLEKSNYVLQLNKFADLTKQEIARITGSKINEGGENITALHRNFVVPKNNIPNLPESFDWREKGCVTPAGFQGSDCGSCWSFATVAAIEGHLCRRTGVLVSLSEQNLVDCADDYGSEGCDGGFQEYAFEYILDHGITLAAQYPYVQTEDRSKSQCPKNETGNNIIRIRDYARIKPGDEEKMKEVISKLGPIACSINGSPISFHQYSGGVYDDPECNAEDVNHSIAVVGYGSEGGKDYWIVKNSYSENWGEKGFMKLLRNANSFCGIANECSYPVM